MAMWSTDVQGGRREERSREPGRRFGRLDPAPGLGMHQRCACQVCGAHLMAIGLGADRYEGVCQVCGSDRISPLQA